MLNFILSAIPEELADIWYVYDLILIAIIVVSIILIRVLKKRSNLKEAEQIQKKALKTIDAARIKNGKKIKIQLRTAKNLLSSAEYYFSLCVIDSDMYDLKQKTDLIEKTNGEITTLINNCDDLTEAEIDAKLAEILTWFNYPVS